MKSLFLISLILAVVITMASVVSAGKPVQACFIRVEVTGCPNVVTLGASDLAFDVGTSLPADQNYVGVHLGIAPQDLLVQIIGGSKSPLARRIDIWSNDPYRNEATLHWWTVGSYYNKGISYSRQYWPRDSRYLLSFIGIENPITPMKIGAYNAPREGWITFPIWPSSPGQGYALDVRIK